MCNLLQVFLDIAIENFVYYLEARMRKFAIQPTRQNDLGVQTNDSLTTISDRLQPAAPRFCSPRIGTITRTADRGRRPRRQRNPNHKWGPYRPRTNHYW